MGVSKRSFDECGFRKPTWLTPPLCGVTDTHRRRHQHQHLHRPCGPGQNFISALQGPVTEESIEGTRHCCCSRLCPPYLACSVILNCGGVVTEAELPEFPVRKLVFAWPETLRQYNLEPHCLPRRNSHRATVPIIAFLQNLNTTATGNNFNTTRRRNTNSNTIPSSSCRSFVQKRQYLQPPL